MIFHGYYRSSSAHRCRIALNLKGLQPETISHHLRRGGGEQKLPSYRAINPQALVPSLVEPGAGPEDGPADTVLTQSLAIIEWLDETFPGPELLPKDALLRAHVRAFSQVIACDTHPLQNLRVLQYLEDEFRLDPSEQKQWCQRWISDGLAACEALLKKHSTSDGFCFGPQPSLADICLVPQVYSAQRFEVDLKTMPRVWSVFQFCEHLPAFQDARPSNQPDAET